MTKIEIDELGYYTAPDGGKWKVVPVEATDEMVRMMLCVRWPALFKEYLRHPWNGPKSAADDEKSIQEAIKQFDNAIKAAPPPPIPATRYDWSKIPEGYDWAATDEDGDLFAYSKSPHIKAGQWAANFGVGVIGISPGDPCQDWRESLEKRPGT